jgi:beta-aspartyl-dipeptidase (metallo-type)
MDYAKKGGVVDITSSIHPITKDDPEVRGSEAIRIMLENGVPETNITMSSDGNGSSPVFDSQGHLMKLGVGSLSENHKEFCNAVFKEELPIATALMPLTSNAADVLKLSSKKGRIPHE